jgi:MerR family transcriptional regulator, redox-sensitive transcriptional activator SoxR
VESMTIGEVARRARLRASAVRYYEKIGLLPTPQRIRGQRRYESRVLEHLAVISVAKRVGFRIDEIKHLFHGFRNGVPAYRRWQILAQRKLAELDEMIVRAKQIKRLLRKAERCKCLSLEDCGGTLLRKSSP